MATHRRSFFSSFVSCVASLWHAPAYSSEEAYAFSLLLLLRYHSCVLTLCLLFSLVLAQPLPLHLRFVVINPPFSAVLHIHARPLTCFTIFSRNRSYSVCSSWLASSRRSKASLLVTSPADRLRSPARNTSSSSSRRDRSERSELQAHTEHAWGQRHGYITVHDTERPEQTPMAGPGVRKAW